MVREPYAVTQVGLVWLIETEAGERVLQFPSVEADAPETWGPPVLPVWQALERLRSRDVARVELASEAGSFTPYVGFSPDGEEGSYTCTSASRWVPPSAISALARVGLHPSSVPSATVLVGEMGSRLLVCSAVRLPRARGWKPLQELIDEAGGNPSRNEGSEWAEHKRGWGR